MDSLETILNRLDPELSLLEERRQHALQLRSRAWHASLMVALIGLVLALTWGQHFMPVSLFFAVAASVISGAVIHQFVAGPAIQEFAQRFKTNVVRELIRGMAPGLEFRPGCGISEEVFCATQLFSTRPDRYHTEDCLSGRMGSTEIVLAEINAEERRQSRDSKGRTTTHYVTIFRGILFIAGFPKQFQGVTRILPDQETGLLAGIGKAVQGFFPFGSKDLVRLEDAEFENHFRVYSSDQVEARYLLSTSLMRRILELRETWGGCDLRISFLDSRIHLAIPCKQNLFEPSLNESLLVNTELRRIAIEIRSCLELVEQLHLDTRIWSRQANNVSASGEESLPQA